MNSTSSPTPELDDFSVSATAWLDAHASRRPPSNELRWGVGSDRVGLFRDLTPDEEETAFAELRGWQRAKYDAGFGAISWPVAYGGRGLRQEFELAFRRLEAGYATPPVHEAMSISLEIVAPTLRTLGSEAQRRRWLAPLRRADTLACQMFSEPDAGSDLGSIGMRAARDQAGWSLTGQKVWTSGAHLADLGLVIARTGATADRRTDFTAFVVPMDAAGISVRPLRQMTGGASFNEVFFDDVRVADEDRLDEVGAGWKVMMTTLGFERSAAARGGGGVGPDLFGRLLLQARRSGRNQDPVVRQALAHLYASNRVRSWTGRRAAAQRSKSGVPGPEGSVSKLALTNALQETSAVASLLLGGSLLADTGEWGTFAWSEFVCGVPGLRLGGGSDEIQRNTIAERALGLPKG